MKKIVDTWRKATLEELENGSSEMILVSSEEIEVPVPDREVPSWKVKAILKIMDLEASVNAAIDSLDEPIKTMAQMSWEYGSVINQSSPTVNLIKSAISLTDEQVNDIFNQAESINI